MSNDTNANDKILTLCLKEINLTPPAPSGISTLVGEIKVYPANNVPEGYLECNGAPILRSEFPELFEVLGTLYGAGDGVNTFNLPDLRGEFIRGFDNGRGVDTNRPLGSEQSDSFSEHNHLTTQTDQIGDLPNYEYGLEGNIRGAISASLFNGLGAVTSSVGGSETRPRNIAMMYIIKT